MHTYAGALDVAERAHAAALARIREAPARAPAGVGVGAPAPVPPPRARRVRTRVSTAESVLTAASGDTAAASPAAASADASEAAGSTRGSVVDVSAGAARVGDVTGGAAVAPAAHAWWGAGSDSPIAGDVGDAAETNANSGGAISAEDAAAIEAALADLDAQAAQAAGLGNNDGDVFLALEASEMDLVP